MTTTDELTYAETWADRINETYGPDGAASEPSQWLDIDDELDDEDDEAAIRRVLTKAADCLRGGVPATFTGPELDLVRHLMPAHEVHQSLARRWVRDRYGETKGG